MTVSPLDPWIRRKIGAVSSSFFREELQRYQLGKIRETLLFARTNSPFYRSRLAGVDVGTIVSPDSMGQVPFTTAVDLCEKASHFLCVSQTEISRVVTLQTSGTAGPPKRIFFTATEQALTADFFHHGMKAITEPGAQVLILFPGEKPGSVGDLLSQGLDRLGASGVQHGFATDLAAALSHLRKHRIRCIAGLPHQVLALARYAEACGGSGETRIRSVVLSGDPVSDFLVAELTRIWSCTIFTHYGMTEMGLAGGVECSARNGYHLREADFFFEIVDPVSGEPVADGERGEVVFTTLTRRGMPLIRYRTGDISRFIMAPCPCGTVLRRMERIAGRIDSPVFLGNGEKLTVNQLSDVLLPIPGVLDFTADLFAGMPSDELRITLHCLSARPPAQSAVQAVLQAVPELRDVLLTLEFGRADFVGAGKKRLRCGQSTRCEENRAT